MSKARTPKSNPKKEASAKSFSGSASSNQTEMKTSEIRDLIDFISKTGLNEVNIETQQLKLHVKREPDQKVFKSTPVMGAMAPAAAPVSAPVQQAQQSSAPRTEAPVSSGKKTADIKSPMIGTFYRSSGPESAPFVSVGDKVSKGQTVCIIEAMKLFNEIESEVSGTIIKVMAENSSPVEYDQVLFVVEPD
jgi:acetyl-CoA carboxylase biotin carboxyl carrier protein